MSNPPCYLSSKPDTATSHLHLTISAPVSGMASFWYIYTILSHSFHCIAVFSTEWSRSDVRYVSSYRPSWYGWYQTSVYIWRATDSLHGQRDEKDRPQHPFPSCQIWESHGKWAKILFIPAPQSYWNIAKIGFYICHLHSKENGIQTPKNFKKKSNQRRL